MTKKKREKLEAQKIKEWREQGYSEAEIAKKLEKSRKTRKVKSAAKVIVVTLAIGATAIGIYKVADKVISDLQSKLSPEEQKDLDEKKKEEEKLKDDISKDTPDKDPNEIVIPVVPTKEDGATDEEIAEAQQKADEAKKEKEYWMSVKETKEKISDNISDQISEITKNDPNFDKSALPEYLSGFQKVRRINNAYVMEDGSLIVDCDYLYQKTYANGESVLRQANASFRFVNPNLESTFNTTQDLINFMQNEATTSEMFGLNNGLEYEELADVYYNHINHLGLLNDYAEQGAKVELEKITAYEFDGECPVHYYCTSKVTNGDKIIYVVTDVTSQIATQNMTMEEWKTWAKDPTNKRGVFSLYEYSMNPLNFDWKALSEEYSGQKTQEAQAQAEIEEISTRNENGNVTGFDWNAYKDLMKQKEAEKEAKELEQTATQQASVTYSDQELSL